VLTSPVHRQETRACPMSSLPPFLLPTNGWRECWGWWFCRSPVDKLPLAHDLFFFSLTYLGRVTVTTRAFIQYTYILHDPSVRIPPPLARLFYFILSSFSFVFEQGKSALFESGMTTRSWYVYNMTIWHGPTRDRVSLTTTVV